MGLSPLTQRRDVLSPAPSLTEVPRKAPLEAGMTQGSRALPFLAPSSRDLHYGH